MRILRRGRRRGAMAVIGAAIAIAAWTHAGSDFGYRGETVAVAAPEVSGDIASLLDQVTVVDRVDQMPGYERSCKKGKGCVFGPAWNDPTDRSGCDTRSRILTRDLRDITYKDGTRNCKVIAGWLQDPYSGERVDLSDVEVDHVVALHHVWNAGAWQWDSRKRQIFANDPIELRAISSSVNRAKSDSGIDEWLPPNPAARCPFVAQYLTVLIKYELPITVREKNAALSACAR
ncbi:HNH endonuclease family protein [Mycolicibacterium fortuitum]|uniref:HNH endonuclease family protein n=2 Tax=Mycolicibacterium fortuitum TaxID=1766 RepID=A0AAE4VG81_MYCFO|nr:HNH endonuclease family protein [Mycolicibacterium fortuitum]MCV7137928.1 HNH endonuclease [Mycolicibacterium fortuitum]MDV7194495.1 HNH endonuclease family protein [Mycolicibacterium fortuitum]MDV7207876.1 HNH endonuclease family protein [Mycolicibacterium fortuitum]MDV7229173.1 HNH endonuclease family protein [Mycolicibacterium fortuitum]MDV7260873.1 HNH endonuclease family protein [Mycolicibacterium fortuitum]